MISDIKVPIDKILNEPEYRILGKVSFDERDARTVNTYNCLEVFVL